MVLSTEIPKAILKTRIVEGLSGIPANPIIPAVIKRGTIFGIREIMHSPSEIQQIITELGHSYRMLTLEEVEGKMSTGKSSDFDQKLIFVIQKC